MSLSADEERLYHEIKAEGRFGPAYTSPCGFCGRLITPVVPRADHGEERAWDNPPEGAGEAFRDLLSLREWQITATCQRCQDLAFAEPPE